MQRCVSILAAGVFAATASAQFFHTIPNGRATTEGNSNNAFPWGTNAATFPGMRIQAFYDSANFTAAAITAPIVISRLKWRANAVAATTSWVGGTYSTASIRMSTAAVDQSAITTNYLTNEGSDLTTVYTGPVTVMPGTGNGTGIPGPFVVDQPLTTPFLYFPARGDLSIDTDYPGGSNYVGGTLVAMDVDALAASLSSRVFSSTFYPAANGITPNHGLVVQMEYSTYTGLLAAFSANVTGGVSPLAVNFTDQSYSGDPGGITSWAWDFDGDNVIDSNLQNPSFVYNNCGTYNVSLTVTDAVNPPSTWTRVAYVKTDEIVASFTSAILVAPNVYQFTDTTTPAALAWDWDFDGDNVTDSTLQNPTWSFPVCQSSAVRLIVTRNCRSSTKTNYVNPIGSNNTASSSVAGGNGNTSVTYIGNMFNISVTNPQGINICALGVTPYGVAGPFTMNVYVTPDTYVGNNLVASRWRLIGTGNGISAGVASTVNPPVVDVALGNYAYLAPGNYGVAVYLNRTPLATMNIAYSNGPIGPFANGDVTIHPVATVPGIATLGLFSGSTTASRSWNGRIYYSTIANGGDAGYGFFGPGCAGSMGITNLQHANRPQLGSVMTVNANNLPLSIAIMMIGFSRTVAPAPFGALPLDATPYGAPGCFGRVSPDVTSFLIGGGNTASWLFGVPNDPGLMGLPLFNQALVPDPGFNGLGAVFSDATALIVGT